MGVESILAPFVRQAGLCIASAGRERPLLHAAARVRAGSESSQDRCCLGGARYGVRDWRGVLGCEHAG
jgi:hypothetical protein